MFVSRNRTQNEFVSSVVVFFGPIERVFEGFEGFLGGVLRGSFFLAGTEKAEPSHFGEE